MSSVTGDADQYEELKRAEKKYREFLEYAVQGVFQVTPEGRYLYANPALASLFGFDSAQMLIEKVTDIGLQTYVNPEDRKKYRHALETAGFIRGFEVELLKRDSTPFWVSISSRAVRNEAGTILYYEGTLEDITERKRMESALKESEEKYRALVENAGEAIFVAQDGVLRFVNRKAAEMTGYSEDELRCRVFAEFIHPEDRAIVVERYARRLRGEKVLSRYAFRILCRSGDAFWVELNVVQISWEGRPATLNFLSDISERLRAEAEKARLEEQFQQAQKMESVGRLAGGVAHDLNNLLTPIIGYGEMLFYSAGENDTRKKSAAQVVQAGMRARDLVQQLLAFSRKQVLEFKPFDLNLAVRDFEKLLRRTIREDIDIHIVQGSDLPIIRGDIGQIEQVIMNLAVNAQDAMPRGGMMTIETGVVKLDAAYAAVHEGVLPGSYVLLAFSDNGEGMDSKTRALIFEPFFTTKEKGKGTGLGLATVYGIVKQHGGNIWVYSEPGKGTTFKIYLPIPKTAADIVEVTHAVRGKDLRGVETILLVEDEDFVRDLARDILQHYGYKVLIARGGQEALSLLKEHQGVIHLILTDVVMPGMNGKDLYTQAVLLHPGLKVLYMSGYTEETIARHGVLDEGVFFIQKPFSVQALAEKVRMVLSGS